LLPQSCRDAKSPTPSRAPLTFASGFPGLRQVQPLTMVTTLVPRDDPSKFTYATEKYFINGKEISNESGESKFVAYDDDSKAPYGMKQGYGIFVTNESYIKGSFPFPIRYFNVLSPN
jgi:hypothetical protein